MVTRSGRVVLVLAVVAASALALIALLGGDDGGPAAAEPRPVAAERRAFTNVVPLAATVDVAPGINPAALAPGTPVPFLVMANVDPIVLYRLPEHPTQATVRIVGGPPEFPCAGVDLATVPAPPAGASSADTEDSAEELDPEAEAAAPPQSRPRASAQTLVRCLVPATVRVFPGLRAELLVTTAQIADAIVVPAGAVEQDSLDSGYVTVIGDGEDEERRKVGIGPSDGSVVVITSGLSEGERVLDRVPIQEDNRRRGSSPPAEQRGGGQTVVR